MERSDQVCRALRLELIPGVASWTVADGPDGLLVEVRVGDVNAAMRDVRRRLSHLPNFRDWWRRRTPRGDVYEARCDTLGTVVTVRLAAC